MLLSPGNFYLGTDIVEITRFKKALSRSEGRFLQLIFTQEELQRYQDYPQSLAVRFAAKEAVAKALGVGFRYWQSEGIDPTHVEILSLETQQPTIQLFSTAAEKSKALSISQWQISLSHTKQYALAVALGISENYGLLSELDFFL